MQVAKRAMRKVPEVTIYFWIVKLLSTAMGESTSDYLVYHINPYIAVALGGIGLVASLVLQLLVRRYIPWIYWLAVVMVAIFGTMTADVMHVVLGIPYYVSTLFFAVMLAVIFVVWYRSEKTLSIHSITTPRRELFYWATVIATFALGTAAGDLTASTFELGYFASGVLFAVLFAGPGSCLPAIWSERDCGLLVCLHHDAATRRFVCRLVWKANSGWPGAGGRTGCPGLDDLDHRLCRLFDRHSQIYEG